MNDAPSSLRAVLDAERDAVLTGDFVALSRLLPEKERLMSMDFGVQADDLHRLATRNQALLTAAMAGLREASVRIGHTRQARGRFTSYGADGARQERGLTASTFERRA